MKQAVSIALTLLCGSALSDVRRVIDASPDGAATNPPPAAVSGAIEGVITFHGEIPKSATADDAGARRDLLQVDQKSGGLRYVVVWLAIDKAPANERESQAASPPGAARLTVLMDQRDHEFVPRLLAVRSGQPVKFTNSDPANHNVRTSSPQRTNEFNVFTGVDGSYTHRFVPDPQQRPVRVGCDIHPWMRGWIYVFEHPYFAVTDTQGRFRIAAAPPGRYKLMICQPDVGYSSEQEITVAHGIATSVEVQIKRDDLKTK